MKKRIIAIIVLTIFVVFMFFFRKEETSTREILKNAQLKGETAVCTFSINEEDFRVYVSSNKIMPDPEKEMTFRTREFTFENENIVIESNTIYVWNGEGKKYLIPTMDLEHFLPGITYLDDDFFETIEKNYYLDCKEEEMEINIPEYIQFEEEEEEEEEEEALTPESGRVHDTTEREEEEMDEIDKFFEEHGDDYDLEDYWDFLESLEDDEAIDDDWEEVDLDDIQIQIERR